MENKIPIGEFQSDVDLSFKSLENGIADGDTEFDEILSHKAPFIVRWGTAFFFFMLIIIALIVSVINYPDTVTANGFLNAINGPKEVSSKLEGKLTKLFVQENQLVRQGEILGYLESTASHTEILNLMAYLDTAATFLNNENPDRIIQQLLINFDSLGELQTSFQIYMQSLREFSEYLKKGFYIEKKKMLIEDVGFMMRMHQSLLSQKVILSQDLELADSTFKSNEILRKQTVISALEYRSEKSKLLSKQMTLPQINALIISNENSRHEKYKEILELESKIRQQKGIFSQELNTFKSQMEEWKKKYLLAAPIDGKVSFSTFVQENQLIKSGQLICFINPESSKYYIEALVPQYNFGKVKIGELVILKFKAYPFEEYGAVQGKVISINSIPNDSGYLTKIDMPAGLVTNYGKEIQYKNGLSVKSEIITQNKNLLQRLFQNFVRKTNR